MERLNRREFTGLLPALLAASGLVSEMAEGQRAQPAGGPASGAASVPSRT